MMPVSQEWRPGGKHGICEHGMCECYSTSADTATGLTWSRTYTEGEAYLISDLTKEFQCCKDNLGCEGLIDPLAVSSLASTSANFDRSSVLLQLPRIAASRSIDC